MRSPLVRLPLALLFVVPVFIAQGAVWALASSLGKVPVALLSLFIASVLGWAVYALYTRWIECRRATEFARAGALRELSAGLLIGAGVFGATLGVIALLGGYRITGMRSDLQVLIIPFCVSFAAAVIEEILFRGVIFRLLEESFGTWIALGVSAALFGLGHMASPHATVYALLAIALEAGVMLGAAYVLTRRLWLAIGIHAAWNFTQAGIFGVPTSGIAMHGLFVGSLAGPAWLSGGEFGAEASVVATVLCSAVGVALLALAHRRGRFIAPFWQRRGAAVGGG